MQCNKLTSDKRVHFDAQKYQTIPSDSVVQTEIVCPYSHFKTKGRAWTVSRLGPFHQATLLLYYPTANGAQQA